MREETEVETTQDAAATSVTAPLYTKVRREILSDLRDGRWRAGHRLPTEPQLANRFGVSISTVRKAIDLLVSERILLRQAGRGTTVACYNNQENFESFSQLADETGRPVTIDAEVLGCDVFDGHIDGEDDADIRAKLGSTAPLARIVNLRCENGKPLILDRLFLPLDIFKGLTGEAFQNRGGLIYGFYQEHFGVTVVRVEEALTACPADAETAAILGVAPQTPLLRIERLAFSFDDRPVEWRYRLVNTSHCAYRNVIGLKD
ncbi:MAG TPA: GntR family transcriptional regulator [Stellaceae bacterium]|nr:GntR family transcriptional regulator [Stellaceae bacterium]